MIQTKSKDVILNEILNGIVQETDIRMTGNGSVTRAIASAISTQIGQVYSTISEAINNRFLSTASGAYLDLFGETFGLYRRPSHAASVTDTDRIIRVYTRTGTLASKLEHPTNLNLGRVPQGTQIMTTSGIIYTVDRDYDFPASAKEVYVGAASSVAGVEGNVGANALTVHELGDDILTTNISAITSGSTVENDSDFRFRIASFTRSSAGSNSVAVLVAALSAPGVADVKIYPYFFGPGSFKVVLIPKGSRLGFDSRVLAESEIRNVVSEGVYFKIDEPDYISVGLSARLVPLKGTSISETDRQTAKNAILRYLGDIRPGQSLIVNQLRSVILNSSTNIADVKIQSMQVNDAPVSLVDYKLLDDEVFIESLEEGIEVV